MTVERRLDNIDAQLAQLVIASAQLLEATRIQTDQIGRLTEGLTEIKLIGERQERNIARLLDVTERQLRIVERLLPQSDLE